ncbi:MAG: aminotransferase class III-fold pyridoxal phosphate-dependent enzyme [Bacteriovoracaceae bacterium]|nr:aminotransferase class III-fold pyridoxal phosphate-dependent enzyme [Bacteriovoracaceae bacterium]
MNFGATNSEIEKRIDELVDIIQNEHQKINAIKAADPDKRIIQSSILEEYKVLRDKPIFYDYLASGRGNGVFVELVDGSVKYDLIGAIGVYLLGHSHPLYTRAHLEAATKDVIMCGNLQPYTEAFKTSEAILSAVKGSKLEHFWFAGSGSFANDTALKMVWQKKAPNYKLIAFEKCFAGRSVATQDITANDGYREDMPTKIDVERVPHFDQNDPENSISKTIDALNAVWAKAPGKFCAMMMEVVQGEGGFIYGTKEWYHAVCKWAQEKEIYVWFDEVQTFGRTHKLFAHQMFELGEYADIVTIGKALQGCGVLFSKELSPRPGLIAGTFNGSVAGLNAATKTINFLQDGGFYGDNGRIAAIEKKIIGELNVLKSNSCSKKIGHIGGVGTMLSFEVGDAGGEVSKSFIKALFENGVISFTAGRNPTRIRFLVPVTITDKQIDDIMTIVEKTIHEVVS